MVSYAYPLPFRVWLTDKDFMYTSVPNGMITNMEVRLIYPTGLVYITLDGEAFFPDGEIFGINGRYEIFSIEDPYRPFFVFTVASGPVNFLEVFTAPNGYIITDATFNYDACEIEDDRSLSLEDGFYAIYIMEDRTPPAGVERQTFMIHLIIDRTHPLLYFNGVDEEGNAFGEVTFAADKEVSIRIVRNGSHYAENLWILDEPGHYLIIAVDLAGNEIVYELRILYRMDAAGWWIIALFAALVLGLVAYLIRNRMKIRVR